MKRAEHSHSLTIADAPKVSVEEYFPKGSTVVFSTRRLAFCKGEWDFVKPGPYIIRSGVLGVFPGSEFLVYKLSIHPPEDPNTTLSVFIDIYNFDHLRVI